MATVSEEIEKIVNEVVDSNDLIDQISSSTEPLIDEQISELKQQLIKALVEKFT